MIKFLFASSRLCKLNPSKLSGFGSPLKKLITNSIKGPTSPSPRCSPKMLSRIMSSKQGEGEEGRGCPTWTEGVTKEGVSPQRLSRAVWVTWPKFLLRGGLELSLLVHVLEKPMAATWVEPNRTERWRQTTSIWTGRQLWDYMTRRWTRLCLVCCTLLYQFNSVQYTVIIETEWMIFEWISSFFSFYPEFKVFNIVIIALALCILTITGLYCITVCYNRTRWGSDVRYVLKLL